MQNTAWEIQKLLEEKYDGKESGEFFADVRRLKQGEPLAYIIGHVPFLNTAIFLESRPMIPRVETEFWVEKVLEQIKNSQLKELKVLDLCAGSGCIGVAVLKNVTYTVVDFVEIDTSHHPTILKNLNVNKIAENRYAVMGGDLFEQVANTYDVILSNPPYINKARGTVLEHVKKYEPENALYGGSGGLEYIESIIKAAPKYLRKNGSLYLEHEPEQTKEVQKLSKQVGFTCTTQKDQYGKARYSQLLR